ncbi:MAG: TrmB family transcriptional regulator, partial [Ardenticatenaceae bacterium]
MSDAIALLQQLGFGHYEARAYVALLQHDPVTGYELAKVSGIPRPNIYTVLQKLEERGVVIRLDIPEGTRYAPVPFEEFLQRADSRFQSSLTAARRELKRIARAIEPAYVWNARDYPVLLEHARALVDGADKQLLLAIWPDEAHALADSVAEAETRGVELTTLCMMACAEPCGSCRGLLCRCQVVEPSDTRWLLVVPDGEEVLAGEVQTSGQALAVRTRQHLLVDLTTWFIRHSIALVVVLNDLGDRLEELLDPETRATLAAIGPEGEPGWLEYM